MYTSEKRSWSNNCGFRNNTNIGLTHVCPISVIPLTGNTTIKMEMTHYLQTQGTPLPLYEGMRVDVDCYFLPQRLYTRGMYGNNITESMEMEQLPLPTMSIVDNDSYYLGENNYSVVLRGSLLNRLGVAPQICGPTGNRPIRPEHIVDEDETILEIYNGGNAPSSVNMALVAGYYDICRLYYANLFEDNVPFMYKNIDLKMTGDSGIDSDVYVGSYVDKDGNQYWIKQQDTSAFSSLSLFGQFVNYTRGVQNFENDTIPSSYEKLFYDGLNSFQRGLYFAGMQLLDNVHVSQRVNENAWFGVANTLNNVFSNRGLWPNRYDSHFQTMFFKPEDIGNITAITLGENVQQYRLAEAKYVTALKAMLRGRTVEDWIDVQFGNRLKINDKPIFVGSDRFMVSYQQVVASAGTEATRLGDTSSRGVGGTTKTYDDKGNAQSKPIMFTTQEPGYLMVLARCTPEVSYPDVTERLHDYDTMADFPLPSYDGKLFQSLVGKDFVFTGKNLIDTMEIGKQPYAFDHMTAFNRSSCLFATSEQGSVFNRILDMQGADGSVLTKQYFKSVYVEPEVYDNNFYDVGVNGRLPFKLISLFNIRKCMPFEKQVTDYNL